MAGNCGRTRWCDVAVVLELRGSLRLVEMRLWMGGCLEVEMLKEQTEGAKAEEEKRKYTIE